MSAQINYPVKSGKVSNMILWGLQILLAGMFLMAGSSKLAGNPMMVQTFNAIGAGQWFRYLTGSIEVISAILLLTPRFSGIGALLLVGTMVGAVLTHLLIIGGSPAAAAVLLVIAGIIAWGRRGHLLRLMGKR